MKHIALIASLVATPLWAQESSEKPDGWDLLQEGGRLLLEDLMDDLSPLLEDLQGLMVDLNSYEPPVILPNGDILIRRKPDAPEYTPPPVEDEDAIDL
ncbi:AAA+ family ATPase [Celeribacter litoreus]|uniref:AAA+ family ATPase n=1 Tax=Celeribacter litoreus TaxID=2876714 RepID=UPI001CCBC98D|nr:AAA+ family ATPase [Celeribacter litoreus]MCA0042977.1 AAA+ family ATPase [Celeribacter litoreus]